MSSNRPHAGTITVLNQALRRLDIPLPAALTDELAKIDQAIARLDQAGARRVDLPRLIGDAVLAGRDPATDKDIVAAAVANTLAPMEAAAGAELHGRRFDAVIEHRGAILKSLKSCVEEANEAITAARNVIENLDLTDRSQVGTVATSHMTTWGRAFDHRTRLADVVMAWTSLAGSDYQPMYKPLVLADLTGAEYLKLGPTPQALAAVDAGHALALADFSEHATRVAKVLEGISAERRAEAERAGAAERAKRPSLLPR
jgi:hypothetical protein